MKKQNKDLNRKVASALLRAQLHSDAAKYIHEIHKETRAQKAEFVKCESSYYYEEKENHYRYKDEYILKAITRILSDKNSGFTFYVTYGEFTPYLIYFTFRLDGKRYQISFHSYDRNLFRYFKNSERFRTHWDRRSSRQAAEMLQAYLKRK